MTITAEEGRVMDLLSRGEAVPGPLGARYGACTREGCRHLTLWHGEHGRYKGRPCTKCGCPGWTDEPAVTPEPGATREHGTSARYVWGPDENDIPGKGCHCAACTEARRVAEGHRRRMKAYGQWQPFVDAEPARRHVRALAAAGIGWKRAAELAGVSNGSMSKLLYGGPGDRPPAKRIRPETEAKILAVRPSLDLIAPSAEVDATGTHRRVQALVAVGWSQAKIGARIGMTPGNFGTMMGRPAVSAATARAVRAVFGELWDQAPPEAEWRDKIAANRARNYAAARGWPPPAAWDEDIDDPAAEPFAGWRRPEKRLRGAALAVEARELAGLGVTGWEAAARLGVSLVALEGTLRRHPETAAEGEVAA